MSESDGSTAGLARTVRAWSTALKSLGVKPDAKIIESVLKPTRGKRAISSIYESISNADDVAQVLGKDPEFGKRFRALSGVMHTGQSGNSTMGDIAEEDGFAWIEQGTDA